MEEKKNSKVLIWLIVILIILILGLVGYIVYDKVTNKDSDKQDEFTQPVTNNEVYEFTYKSHELNLLNKPDNINEIYAINVKSNEKSYDLYVKYMDETELKIATIIPKDNYKLESRSLDMENNQLYYIIDSNEDGTAFEMYYFDLNKFNTGAKTLDKFNTVFIQDNLWEVAGSEDVYSSQIYVKEDNIYYTSFNERSLKTYNLKTNTVENIIDNVNWYDYFIDKLNNKIFYLSNSKLYLSDLNGKNQTELDSSLYSSSAFWTNAYYKNSPLFVNPISVSIDDEGVNIDDLYIFDYDNNSFTKIKENISNYEIIHNDIKEITTDNTDFGRTFFIK